MPSPQRVGEGDSGEPEKPSAPPPPHLGDLYRSLEPEINARLKPEAGPASLFTESLSYELNRSLRGAAQIIGAEATVREQAEPQPATDFLGQNAQMLGRAAGGLLPMLGMAVGTRYGFGKVLAHEAEAVEHALLKRTAVGLSAAESGATGFLYGSLFTPTEGAARDNYGSFTFDRVRSGASSGLAFALMSASSIGLSKLASTEIGAAVGAEKLMKIGVVNGIVSGLPGGIANVEADSFVRTGKLDFDKEHLGRSIYEMALFGGTFALGAGMVARMRTASGGVSMESSALPEPQGALQQERRMTGIAGADARVAAEPLREGEKNQDHNLLAQDLAGRRAVGSPLSENGAATWTEAAAAGSAKSRTAANDNMLPVANDNYSRSDRAQEMKMAVGSDLVRSAEWERSSGEQSGAGRFLVIAGDGAQTRLSGAAASKDASLAYSNSSAPKTPLSGGSTITERSSSTQERATLSGAVSESWSRKSVIKAIKEGRDLSGADLRGLDLAGVKFGSINLEGADFSGSDLSGANFSKAKSLNHAQFNGANLEGVNFSGQSLDGASFKGARNFATVKLKGALLMLADFSDTDLRGVDFRSAEWLMGSSFRGAALNNAKLYGLDLKGADFDRADLEGVDFSDCDLGNVNFSRVKRLTGATFKETRIGFADFTGVNLDGVIFSQLHLDYAIFNGASLRQAKFQGASLEGGQFRDSDLAGADFGNARSLRSAKFERADVADANFGGVLVASADFRGAKNLARANFAGANLAHVDFTGCDLTGADSVGAGGASDAKREARPSEGANFSGANLEYAVFNAARLKNFKFHDAQLEGARFEGADLKGADFGEVKSLRGADFEKANLDRTNFTGRDLKYVWFQLAKHLDTAKFNEADLDGANFRRSDLRRVDFSTVKSISGTNFASSDLEGTNFSGRDLSNSDFKGAYNLDRAKFEGAKLKSADFTDSDLSLSNYYLPRSQVMLRLSQKGLDSAVELGLAKFICVNPVLHKSIFEREILSGVSAKKLSEERFLSLASLEGHYGQDSAVMRALTAVERDSNFLPDLKAFIDLDRSRHYDLVAEEALKGGSAEQLRTTRLFGLMKLREYFKDNEGELKQLLDLEASGIAVLSQVSDFIQENPEVHKETVARELEKAAGQDAFSGQFDSGRLRALSSLNAWFGKSSDLMQPILKLEREGLSLTEVAGLLNEDSVKQAHVQTLIAKGASVEEVQKAMREIAGSLAYYLSPADAEYMDRLAENRLRVGQLRAFIADNPTARLELVEELIRNKATVQRFHDQMDLSMLPDDVASRLLDSNKLTVPKIIGPMRNWQSGPYFRESLIEHVRAGKTIDGSSIEMLSDQAQEMTLAKSGDAQDSVEARNQSGTLRSASETTFPITNPRAIEAASIIGEALQRIVTEIPEEKTIVVLGRDALPLYPALRHQGRKVQYFLWSRLQEHDQSTKKQWLREVGPGAVVIDTGYAGSIPDAIRSIDPTASAYLLSSKSQYPQLLQRHDHTAIVDNLEYFPKLVARSTTYTERGGAISRRGNTDEHDDSEMIKNRWTVESLNRQFLRAIGMDEWGAWRYSRYAGLTPAERLGLNSREEVEQHYARVKVNRSK